MRTTDFEDLTRELAHRIWESRGCPHGTDQQDWFSALSILNALTDTRSDIPAEFFHCFTRSKDVDDAYETLRSMLDIGILLTPEKLTFNSGPTVTQARLSLAFIRPDELNRHSREFGPFSLRMKPYDVLVGDLGVSPVWYLPSYIQGNADIFRHGSKLIDGLSSMQNWIHDMRNDPARADQRHEHHKTSRVVMRLLYPTHYKTSTDIGDIYYMQREWRIIRHEPETDEPKFTQLSDAEKQALVKFNSKFFEAKVPVWVEEAGAVVDRPRVDATWKLSANFSEVVSEILVPRNMVDRVRGLNPGVPVSSSEQYCYGYHE